MSTFPRNPILFVNILLNFFLTHARNFYLVHVLHY